VSRHVRGRAGIAVAAATLAVLLVTPAAQAVDTTATALTSSSPSSVYGQPMTFTATVTDVPTPGTVPSGQVGFLIDDVPLSTTVVDSTGKAQYTPDPLSVGTHRVDARYLGSAAFGPSAAALDQVVVMADTDGVITASPDPSVAGQVATFDATFSGRPPSAAHPSSGTVQFTEEDGTPIGPPQAVQPGGRAQLPAAAGSGDYLVRAVFSGNSNFGAATASVSQHVNRAETSTTVTSTPNPVIVGADLTVTVDVAVLEPGNVDLDGAVQMTVNGQPLGAPIDITGFTGLMATVRAPGTPQTGTIVAQYLGGPNTNPSSGSLQQTIAAAATAASSAALPPAVVVTVGTPQRLAAMTTALRRTLLARGLGALGSLTERFMAPNAGKLEQQIFTPSAPRTALAASTRAVRLATAVRTFAAAGAGTVRLTLTAAGRRAVHRARSLKLAIVTRFAPRGGGAAARRVDRFTVKAKRAHARLRVRTIARRGSLAVSKCPRRQDHVQQDPATPVVCERDVDDGGVLRAWRQLGRGDPALAQQRALGADR
jgi:hypothetical protein